MDAHSPGRNGDDIPLDPLTHTTQFPESGHAKQHTTQSPDLRIEKQCEYVEDRERIIEEKDVSKESHESMRREMKKHEEEKGTLVISEQMAPANTLSDKTNQILSNPCCIERTEEDEAGIDNALSASAEIIAPSIPESEEPSSGSQHANSHDPASKSGNDVAGVIKDNTESSTCGEKGKEADECVIQNVDQTLLSAPNSHLSEQETTAGNLIKKVSSRLTREMDPQYEAYEVKIAAPFSKREFYRQLGLENGDAGEADLGAREETQTPGGPEGRPNTEAPTETDLPASVGNIQELVGPAAISRMEERLSSFISPRLHYSDIPGLEKHTSKDTHHTNKLRRDKLLVVVVNFVEMAFVFAFEITLIVTAPVGGTDGYTVSQRYLIAIFTLNYIIVLFLLIDALRSNNSVQLAALVVIKATNSIMAIIQVRDLYNTGPTGFTTTVDLAICVCVGSWAGWAAYSRLARRLQVRLKWTILVAIGGFNEQTQRLVGAYLAFDCVMKFCLAYSVAYVVVIILTSIYLDVSTEIVQHCVGFFVYIGTTSATHILGHRESPYLIIPVVVMTFLASGLLFQAVQFGDGTCDFCDEYRQMASNQSISFDFYAYLSLTLSFYLFSGVGLSVYMYVSFYLDGFSGRFSKRLKGQVESLESLGLY